MAQKTIFVRMCKNPSCREQLYVKKGETGIICTRCGTEHNIIYEPKLEIKSLHSN